MAIVQRNLYTPPQNNLSNLSINIDDLRIGVDLTSVTINFSLLQATINAGSYIECNGNGYYIQNSSETISITTNHRFIAVTDEGGTPVFYGVEDKGTYNTEKLGWYQSDGYSRTIGWGIDHTRDYYGRIDLNKPYFNLYANVSPLTVTTTPQIVPFDPASVGIPSDVVLFDLSLNYSGDADAPFLARTTGYKWVYIENLVSNSGGSAGVLKIIVRNTTTSEELIILKSTIISEQSSPSGGKIMYMNTGEQLEVEFSTVSGTVNAKPIYLSVTGV